MDPVTVASVATTVATLTKEYGPKVSRFIGDKINKDKEKTNVFLTDMATGLGVTDSLKKIFGDELPKLLEEAKKTKKIQYESNCNQYIPLDIDKNWPKDKQNDLLKAELAENLERLQEVDSDEHLNKARMIVNQWTKKFIQIKYPDGNVDEDTIKKIKVLEDILKPGKMNGKEAFKKLQKAFGASAVLTLMYTACLATGTGLGVFVTISYALFGIPMGQVFGGLTLAGILAYLALLTVNNNTKIQLVLDGLYGIIDEKIEGFIEMIQRDNLQSEHKKLLIELEKKLSSKNMGQSELVLIIGLLKHAVLVDEFEHEAETKVFRNFVIDEYTLSDQEIDSLYKQSPIIEDIDGFLIELNVLLSEEEKNKIVNAIKKITVADLKIHKNETELLRVINKHFNII